ncbi:hypothetical protein NM688_g7534 [Phlebia brevispora]|uniref:Uncharacterized protein n=1 Tax=Phlebia brevispora TaxID=194682 RepID=A0ACC1S475_9APHY|nr:hypothetical protein NM688_g7534 [Phlebia brevispora]
MELVGDHTLGPDLCESCLHGKQTRAPIPTVSSVDNLRVLHCIYSDICGPMPTVSRQGFNSFLTFIDGNSHLVKVELIRTKDEMFGHTKAFIERAEVETNKKVNFFRSDGGGEYGSQHMADYLKSKGIHHEKTTAYTPQQNGVAERMNRTLVEMARCLLHDAGLPNKYWGDAVLHAAYIINCLPTRAIDGDLTPYEVYTGRKPSLSTLRIFGSKAYVHIPDEKRKKLDPKTLECTFISYVENKRAYRLVQRSSGRIIESRDVVFQEGSGNTPARVSIEVAPPPPHEDIPSTPAASSRKATVEDCSDDEDEDEVRSLLGPGLDADTRTPTKPPTPEPPRRSSRQRRTPVPDDDARYFVSSYEPKTMPKPTGSVQWQEAILTEMQMLQKLGVYKEVPRPSDRRVVSSTWAFRQKCGPLGKIEKYKARLCAKGYTQVQGLDYNETFAPVVKFDSIRVLLAIAAKYNLEIHQMDVKSAFLNADLEEEIYMECPEGFNSDIETVWRLFKSLYGLKQASREWYKRIEREFRNLGYKRSDADYSIFYKVVDGVLLIVAVYVDDMLIFGNNVAKINALKKELGQIFEMTDLGEATWILNMELICDRAAGTITLSQRQYIESILKRHQMADCRPLSMPMEANLHLPKLAEPEIELRRYQSALRSLMYAMLATRPDLAHSVGVLSQHAATPGEVHWNALMCVYRYLRGTTDLALTFRRNAKEKALLDFVDADHAGDPVDRRSITGYAFTLAGAAVCWAFKKQRTVAISSTEAEYVAGSAATRQAVWLRLLLSELGQLKQEPTTLLIDNQSAIALAKNPVYHGTMKHIAIQHHFIREKFEDRTVSVEYVPTGDQAADVFTKGLPREKHENYSTSLALPALSATALGPILRNKKFSPGFRIFLEAPTLQKPKAHYTVRSISSLKIRSIKIPHRSSTIYSAVNNSDRMNASQDSAWTTLAEKLDTHDQEMIKGCNDDIDTLLVFAGLFSSVLTAFVIEVYRTLQVDLDTVSAQLLQQISNQLNSFTLSPPYMNSTPSLPSWSPLPFQPSPSAIRINSLWFFSLVISLVVASLSIFIKQWLREYRMTRCTSPEERIRVRHFRYEGLVRWGVFEIAAILPLLLQLSLVLFFIGLSDFLRSLSPVVGWLITVLIVIWLFLFCAGTLAPFIFPQCPFTTPLLKPFITITRRSIWRLRKASGAYLRGKYYNYPGDEMGIRRDDTLDLNALIHADRLFRDDGIVTSIIIQCLDRFRGADLLLFTRHMLSHRLYRALPVLSSRNGKDGTKGSVDFTRLHTHAVGNSVKIMLPIVRSAVTVYSTSQLTAAQSTLHQSWFREAVHLVFATLDHCAQKNRDIGVQPLHVIDLHTRLLTRNYSYAIRLWLTLRLRYPAVPFVPAQCPINYEVVITILHVAGELSEEYDSDPSSLLQIVLDITRWALDRYHSEIILNAHETFLEEFHAFTKKILQLPRPQLVSSDTTSRLSRSVEAVKAQFAGILVLRTSVDSSLMQALDDLHETFVVANRSHPAGTGSMEKTALDALHYIDTISPIIAPNGAADQDEASSSDQEYILAARAFDPESVDTRADVQETITDSPPEMAEYIPRRRRARSSTESSPVFPS